MKAVILATENGAGLGQKEIPKALAKVLGLTLLERNLHTLKRAGVEDFVIVTGYKAELIEYSIKKKGLGSKFNLKLIKDKNYKKGSAYSVLATKDHVNERFLILPTDIVFDPSIIQGLKEEEDDLVVCLDSKPKYISTKILPTKVGIFLCPKNVFSKIDECTRKGITKWDDCMNEFMKGGKASTHDVRGSFWHEVSTSEELKKASWLLSEKAREPKPEGCPITSVWEKPAIIVGRYLGSAGITGNQVTLLEFMAFLSATFFFSLGEHIYFIIGGLLFYFCIVLDWTDGLVARVRFEESKYGEWLDFMSGFIGWELMLFGMTFGLYRQDPRLLIWIIGLLAMFGLLMSQCVASQSRIIFGLDRIGVSKTWKVARETNKAWRIFYKGTQIISERFIAIKNVLFLLILPGAILNQMFYVLLIFCVWYNLWLPYLCAQLVLFRPYSR